MTLNTNFILLERVKCAIDPVYFLNNYGYVFDAKQKKISKMTCFQYQEKCVRDFHKFQNNIVLKSRQCLPGDTFVDTPDGPKPIQDFKIGDLVYSYNLETNQIEMDTVADAWCSGERQCVKLKLKDSRNVEVGENHPFWIVNKQAWVKAKDLNVDDEILHANIGFGDININKDERKLALSTMLEDKKIEHKKQEPKKVEAIKKSKTEGVSTSKVATEKSGAKTAQVSGQQNSKAIKKDKKDDTPKIRGSLQIALESAMQKSDKSEKDE